jgi:hypothetical protein
VKFAERGLAGYGKPGNYFDRQIGRWSKQYKASADGAGPMSQPDPGDGAAGRMAAGAHPAGGARREQGFHRARRLPPGQP